MIRAVTANLPAVRERDRGGRDTGRTRRFVLRRSVWTYLFLGVLGGARPVAELGPDSLRLRMGAAGGGRVPLQRIVAVGTMRWPWWGGLGVRIARGLTAFIGSSGDAVLLELSEPVKLRAPLPWSTSRIAVAAQDVEGLLEAIVEARAGEVRLLGRED